MNVNITPHKVYGKISAIGSKSHAHRVLIAASLLAKGRTKVYNLTVSEDISATINCLKELGVCITPTYKNDGITKNVCCESVKDVYSVIPPSTFPRKVKLDFGESGTTMRFMLPIMAALGVETEFTGCGNLLSRPIKPIFDLLSSAGITVDDKRISGKLKSGNYEIESGISSQFISGTMIALSLLDGESKLTVKGNPVSIGYVEMTVATLKNFGVEINKTVDGYIIEGRSRDFSCFDKTILCKDTYIDGDWSAAANFLIAGAIDGDVEIQGLTIKTEQGDKAVLNVLKDCGASVLFYDNSIRITQNGLKAFDYYAENTPDIVPILCVLAAFCNGITHIYGVNRLKFKESDRLCAILQFLRRAQIEVRYDEDTLIIEGGKPIGGEFNPFNDHRIAMCEAILACYAKGKSIINGVECINKSHPTFFEDLISLGGENYVLF